MENEQKIEFKEIEPGVWKPEEKGDKIEGILINKEPRDGDTSAKYFIENDEGQFLVWGSAIIDSRMKLVNIGEHVRIIFDGQGTNKRGQKLNHFRVAVAA